MFPEALFENRLPCLFGNVEIRLPCRFGNGTFSSVSTLLTTIAVTGREGNN